MQLPSTFILFDTEQNTKDDRSYRDGWSRPGDYREVIEIGAIEISSPDFREIRGFQVLVKPTLRPLLSPHIIGLTGITQEMMDACGIGLTEAAEEFLAFCGGLKAFSFGNDYQTIKENFGLVDKQCPLQEANCDNVMSFLGTILDDLGINVREYTSGTLLEAFGKKHLRAHRALDDMRNLAVVFQELHLRGRL